MLGGGPGVRRRSSLGEGPLLTLLSAQLAHSAHSFVRAMAMWSMAFGWLSMASRSARRM